MNKLFLILLGTLATAAWADDVGLAAGVDNGFGFSWRSGSQPTSFQVTALPLFGASNFFLSAGIKVNQTFHDSEWTRFYGYLGAAGTLGTGIQALDAGTGFGIEFIGWNHLILDLETGLGGGLDAGGPAWGIRVQGGIFYRL